MLAGGIRMYRHEDYEQLKLELPFGVTLREDNRWVLLGKLFPWEAIERKYVENFTVAAGLFCRKMDGRFCRKKPDTDVRRAGRIDVAGVFCRTREGRGQSRSLDSRDLAHQDELYHPVINNRPAILVSVDK